MKDKDIIQKPGEIKIELPRKYPTFLERITGKNKEDKRLLDLTKQMVDKLTRDISEHGRLGIFRNKQTGQLATVICTVFETSPKIPWLWAQIWWEGIAPPQSEIDFHKRFFGVAPDKKFIEALDFQPPNRPPRDLAVVQRWDMGENHFEISYRRNADKEGGNMPVPRPTIEKIHYIEEVLATKIDFKRMHEHYKHPYPGQIYYGDDTSDGRSYIAVWAEDLKNLQIRELTESLPKLTG